RRWSSRKTPPCEEEREQGARATSWPPPLRTASTWRCLSRPKCSYQLDTHSQDWNTVDPSTRAASACHSALMEASSPGVVRSDSASPLTRVPPGREAGQGAQRTRCDVPIAKAEGLSPAAWHRGAVVEIVDDAGELPLYQKVMNRQLEEAL